MIGSLRKILKFSTFKKEEPPERKTPIYSVNSVRSDHRGIYASLNGKERFKLAWNDIKLVAIRIEDEFLPFPYWYIGNKDQLLRIPNDIEGAEALFFDNFSAYIPGYESDTTFSSIVSAMGAVKGSFIIWKSQEAE